MNRITVTGNLGKAPELRYTPTGKGVISLSIADSTGRDRSPIWWKVEVWCGEQDHPAGVCDLQRGARVRVEGYLAQEEWTDQEGQSRRGLKLVASLTDLSLPIRARRADDGTGPGAERPAPPPPSAPASRSTRLPGDKEPVRRDPRSTAIDDDDDLPF